MNHSSKAEITRSGTTGSRLPFLPPELVRPPGRGGIPGRQGGAIVTWALPQVGEEVQIGEELCLAKPSAWGAAQHVCQGEERFASAGSIDGNRKVGLPFGAARGGVHVASPPCRPSSKKLRKRSGGQVRTQHDPRAACGRLDSGGKHPEHLPSHASPCLCPTRRVRRSGASMDNQQGEGPVSRAAAPRLAALQPTAPAAPPANTPLPLPLAAGRVPGGRRRRVPRAAQLCEADAGTAGAALHLC